MSKKELIEKLDEVVEEWKREAMASFWKDGDGLVISPSSWNDFWETVETEVTTSNIEVT